MSSDNRVYNVSNVNNEAAARFAGRGVIVDVVDTVDTVDTTDIVHTVDT